MKRIFFVSVFLIFLAGCYQDFKIGKDILPEEDFANMEVIDTLTIGARTVLSEHVRTDNASALLLGKYEDPYFGTTLAGFVVQMFLIDYPGFPDDIILDSIRLEIPIKEDEADIYYGDPFEPVKVKVYRITDTLNKYNVYYSDSKPNTAQYTLIGDNVLRYDGPDSILTITLNNSWGQYLIDNEEDIFYAYSTYFHQIIRGFYIEPYEGSGAIFKIDIGKDRYKTIFKMKMFYHTESQPDTQFVFEGIQANNISVRYNVFEHDYTGTPIEEQLQNPDNYHNEKVYLQGLAGTKIELNFPYAELLKNKDLIVTKAQLLIKIDKYSIGKFLPLDEIVLMAKDEDGNEVFFEDFIEPVSNSYQGAELEDYYIYKLNVTRFVQNLINGKYDNLHFYLVPRNSSTEFKRSVINTFFNTEDPMRLVIFYTKL